MNETATWPVAPGRRLGLAPARPGIRPATDVAPHVPEGPHALRIAGLGDDLVDARCVGVLLDPTRVAAEAPTVRWALGTSGTVPRGEVTVRSGPLLPGDVRAPADHEQVLPPGTTNTSLPATLLPPRAHRWVEVVTPTGATNARLHVGIGESDWVASWLTLPWPTGGSRPAAEFAAHLGDHTDRATVVRAILYVTALGLVETRIGATMVGRDELAPGWTDYHRRVEYRAYDVTGLFGTDAQLRLTLAEGWYAGYTGFHRTRARYGDLPHVCAQVTFTHADGATSTLATDGTWLARHGSTVAADLQLGEHWDLDRDHAWRPATAGTPAHGPREAARAASVRVTQRFPAATTAEVAPGVWRVDTAQNLAGRLAIALDDGQATRLSIRHAEDVQANGDLYTDALRDALQRDTLDRSDDGALTFAPRFTQHGFRYADVAGLRTPLRPEQVTAEVLHTDLERVGGFRTDHDVVQRIHDAVVWSVRSNSVDLPTDCPQRDERLGWTNTVMDVAPVYAYLFDVEAWFDRWLVNLGDAQGEDGTLPDVAPLAHSSGNDLRQGAPGWADAGVVVPWRLYEWYGDPAVLRRHAAMGVAWAERIAAANPDGRWRNHVGRGPDYGDWLGLLPAPHEFVADASWARTTTILARALGVIAHPAAARWASEAARVAEVFVATHVGPTGTITSGTASAYALALRWGLVPQDRRAQAGDHLAAAVREHGVVTCGYLSAANLLPALTAAGHADLAYEILLDPRMPGWRYVVETGATTLWERWDGWTDELGFHHAWLNSLNHSALGTVAEWLHATVGGIAPAGPGLASIDLAPIASAALGRASTWHRSPRGLITSAWEVEGSVTRYRLTVPPTATASLTLQASAQADITVPAGVRSSGPLRYTVGPGEHEIVVRNRP